MCNGHLQQTALLFFSRRPHEEVDAKQLTFRHGRAAVRLLLKHSLRQARKTQLPLYTCYTPQQRGTTFGQRLANALEDVFAAGHERVIVIGNDSPGLRTRHILHAEEQVSNGQLVLGPAADGGVYLIGLNKNQYDRQAFLNLAWETPNLQESWISYLEQHVLRTYSLPALIDLDSMSDFLRYLRCGTHSLIARCLSVCLRDQPLERPPELRLNVFSRLLSIAPPPRRGPPAYG